MLHEYHHDHRSSHARTRGRTRDGSVDARRAPRGRGPGSDGRHRRMPHRHGRSGRMDPDHVPDSPRRRERRCPRECGRRRDAPRGRRPRRLDGRQLRYMRGLPQRKPVVLCELVRAELRGRTTGWIDLAGRRRGRAGQLPLLRSVGIRHLRERADAQRRQGSGGRPSRGACAARVRGPDRCGHCSEGPPAANPASTARSTRPGTRRSWKGCCSRPDTEGTPSSSPRRTPKRSRK